MDDSFALSRCISKDLITKSASFFFNDSIIERCSSIEPEKVILLREI